MTEPPIRKRQRSIPEDVWDTLTGRSDPPIASWLDRWLTRPGRRALVWMARTTAGTVFVAVVHLLLGATLTQCAHVWRWLK